MCSRYLLFASVSCSAAQFSCECSQSRHSWPLWPEQVLCCPLLASHLESAESSNRSHNPISIGQRKCLVSGDYVAPNVQNVFSLTMEKMEGGGRWLLWYRPRTDLSISQKETFDHSILTALSYSTLIAFHSSRLPSSTLTLLLFHNNTRVWGMRVLSSF